MASTKKTAAPAKAALKKAEHSTRVATKAIKQAERSVAHKAVPQAKGAALKSLTHNKELRAETAKKLERNLQAHAKHAPAKPLHAASVKVHVKATPAKTATKPIPTKTAPKADHVSHPKVSAVRHQGPQLKGKVILEPVADATSEKVFTEVPASSRTIHSSASAVINRSDVMRELSAPTAATTRTEPVYQPSSEKVSVELGSERPPQTHPASAAAAAGVSAAHALLHPEPARGGSGSDLLAEAHSLLHPTRSTAGSTATPVPATSRRPADGGLRRLDTTESGIPQLAAKEAQVTLAHVGQQPLSSGSTVPPGGATAEQTRDETPPVASWRQALQTPSGAPTFGRGPANSSSQPPASTGQAPGLIERRFEIYPDGVALYRWRLVEAATGAVKSVSQTPFGTPEDAETSAQQESQLYRPGTSLVVRVPTSGAQRY